MEENPEARTAILRKRAQALAREPETTDRGQELEIVEFRLAGERYGLETSYVVEAYPLKALTAVPCTPAHVLGIINVRGRIVSVIDFKKFFDLPDKGLGELNKVIILHGDGMEFGVMADAINGVRRLGLDSLGPALPTLTGVRAEYLKGIAEDGTVILDAGRILADEKIVVDEEVV